MRCECDFADYVRSRDRVACGVTRKPVMTMLRVGNGGSGWSWLCWRVWSVMDLTEGPTTKSKPGGRKTLGYIGVQSSNQKISSTPDSKPPYGILSSHQFPKCPNIIKINGFDILVYSIRVEPFFPALGWLPDPCGEGEGENEQQRAGGDGQVVDGGKVESWVYTALWLNLISRKSWTGPSNYIHSIYRMPHYSGTCVENLFYNTASPLIHQLSAFSLHMDKWKKPN